MGNCFSWHRKATKFVSVKWEKDFPKIHEKRYKAPNGLRLSNSMNCKRITDGDCVHFLVAIASYFDREQTFEHQTMWKPKPRDLHVQFDVETECLFILRRVTSNRPYKWMDSMRIREWETNVIFLFFSFSILASGSSRQKLHQIVLARVLVYRLMSINTQRPLQAHTNAFTSNRNGFDTNVSRSRITEFVQLWGTDIRWSHWKRC